MRCPTCGTDNEADSRFCGGCGARIGQQAEPRLAPTHKITDDAPYPQQAAQPAVTPSGPVSYAPPSIPPPQRPASQPPAPRPHVSTASASFTVPPRRPIGLMVAVLILDLGLAAGGAVLLSKGLEKPATNGSAKAAPSPTEKRTEAPIENATAATQVTAAPAAGVPPRPAPPIAAAPTPAPTAAAAVAPAARKDTTKQREASPSGDKKPPAPAAKSAAPAPSGPVTAPVADKPGATKPAGDAKLVTAVPTEPQDPYATVDTAREIDAAAARSKATFDRCAATHGPVQGEIEVAFQVKPDGRIANAAAVANSTGNAELARCLAAEIASWRVSSHGGSAINMSRPFTYR